MNVFRKLKKTVTSLLFSVDTPLQQNSFAQKTNHAASLLLVFFLVAGIFLSGCKEEKKVEKHEIDYTPVTVLEAQNNIISRKTELTGSVLPWKEQELMFQISGRVARILVNTPGEKVRGELRGENNEVIYKGDVIAELDTQPYVRALERAESQLDATKAQLEAAKHGLLAAEETIKTAQARVDATQEEINSIYPLDLKIVEDQRKAAERNYEMTKKARQQGDTTDSVILQAETKMLVARSQEQKVKYGKILKQKELLTYLADLSKSMVQKNLREAEIKTVEAQIRQAESAVKEAQQQLEKCQLYAPFDGVLTNINVIPGVLVNTGVAIAKLVMMDPIRIDVAISFKRLQDFNYLNELTVKKLQDDSNNDDDLRNEKKYETAYLYHVQTDADPSSRTFLATLLARNYKVFLSAANLISQKNNIPIYEKFSGPVRKNGDGTGPMYVDVRCLLKDKDGDFVWRVSKEEPTSTVEKVYVELGTDLIQVINWLFREIKSSSLKEGDIVMSDPPNTVKHGEEILRPRKDWLFRPGELVKVEYDKDLQQGIFLPSEAIIYNSRENKYYVFIAQDLKEEENGTLVGTAVQREIYKQQVESAWKVEGDVKEGEMVIIHGSNHVNDKFTASEENVPVRVTKKEVIEGLLQGYQIKRGQK